MCKKAILNIKSIGRIRKYLSKEDLKRLVNALVISRLDYANSILYGLPKYELDKLQRVQNAAARLITGKKKSDHITPVLKELHWLPIKYRIHFKMHVHFDPPDVHCFPLQRYKPRHMESVLFIMLPRNFGTLYQNILNPLSLF
jgi:hypothetical protein